MTTIFWAGDSTVQFNNIVTYPQSGLGQGLPLYLKKNVLIDNRARNGRSTKSFIDEQRLVYIYDRITEGDFLFVQFGHNDEKKEDTTRYTDPYGDFQVNLEKFANVARNKKAYPVFITPLERRLFDENGVLKPCSHGEYPKAMKECAEKLGVPCIDLTSMSRELLTKVGEKDSRAFHMYFEPGIYENYPEGKKDNTHLRFEGAVQYSKLIAKGLKELGGVYAELLCDKEWDQDDSQTIFSL